MRNLKVGDARRNCGTEIWFDSLPLPEITATNQAGFYGRGNKGVASFMIANCYQYHPVSTDAPLCAPETGAQIRILLEHYLARPPFRA